MLKTNSAPKLIQWQCKLWVKVQFPCDTAWHHLVKEDGDPMIKSVADIFVVAFQWSKNTSSRELDSIQLVLSISIQFNSTFCSVPRRASCPSIVGSELGSAEGSVDPLDKWQMCSQDCLNGFYILKIDDVPKHMGHGTELQPPFLFTPARPRRLILWQT